MSSLKFKNPETGKWEKIRGGGSASLPVKVNILETICEDITLNDENPSYTLPAEITLEEGALYYLDYKAYTSDGTYSDRDSGYQLSKPIDGSVQWMGQEWSWGAVVLTSTGINNSWREPGITAVISIHKVSIEKTDRLLDEALRTEGIGNIASGCNAHAEGLENVAGGSNSHAEGAGSVASGEVSHAEGGWNVASGDYSHAEGNGTEAAGSRAHSEGSYTKAYGEASHAEGHNTIASGWVQHVQGQYNIEDTENKYLHIVGNGTEDTPSNAHTLDWDGNAWFAGDVTDGSGNILSSHAAQHGANGSDPITPEAIGAAPAPLSANIEVYVATTGSDTTGDGSSANPYATIQHVLDTIPKNLGGYSVTINVESGDYAGFEITGFFNGFVGIVGTEDYTVNIGNNSVSVNKCSADVQLKYLHITGTRAGYGVYIESSRSVELSYVQIDGTASVGGVLAKNTSTLVLFRVAVSDKTWHALTCFGSTAFVNYLSGSNNKVGILAGNANTGVSGFVVCGEVTLTATTLYSKAAGGAIIANGALV